MKDMRQFSSSSGLHAITNLTFKCEIWCGNSFGIW